MKYKVGDKVRIQPLEWYQKEIEKEDCYNIFDIFWCSHEMTISKIEKSQYLMEEDGQEFYWTDEMIEGLVEEETKPKLGTALNPIEPKSNANCLTQERVDEMSLDKAGQITDFEYEGLAYTLPEGYIFKDENGNVINATKIVLEKKKMEYPKTFDKCCHILQTAFLCDVRLHKGKYYDIFYALAKLIVCRDAYWKLYGEEMGLGKPWKNGRYEVVYGICRDEGNIVKQDDYWGDTRVFEFPTREMRDAFKENFKELIEQCKELL